MLNVGMVGVGNISGIYLKNFKETFHGVRLVAVCDLVRERAERAQAEYGVPKLYDTMEELFADPEIDIVLNLTRPYQHYAVSKGALLAGKISTTVLFITLVLMVLIPEMPYPWIIAITAVDSLFLLIAFIGYLRVYLTKSSMIQELHPSGEEAN